MAVTNIRKIENAFTWEDDPLYFIFNNEIPGKVKMHTKRLDLRNWISIDRTYAAQMKLRYEIERTQLEHVFVTNSDQSTTDAKMELLDLVLAHLPERFPDKFETREGGIYNKIMEEFVSADPYDPVDPLIRIGRLTQEDWCVMEWSDEHQAYKLTAGVVYFPMRWSLREKWNQPMAGIHKPVKGFMKHLRDNVQDLFVKMPPNAPVWRGNWAVFNDLQNPLDLYTPTGHTDRNEMNETTVYAGEQTGKILTFRAEYQTLRKLPKSNAIIFSIRTYQRFLEEFKLFPKSDTIGLIKAIENLDPDFYIYKGAEYWVDAALKYLKTDVMTAHKKKEIATKSSSVSLVSWLLPVSLAVIGSAVLAGFFIQRGVKLSSK